MPKRCAYKIQVKFANKINKRLQIMEEYITQIRRASEFAREGNILDSFNIISTVGDVYDMEDKVADFLKGSELLSELQDLRDEFLSFPYDVVSE